MKSIDVINIAKAEIGYLEKASNSNLYEKIANAGTNNWTKYGIEMSKIAPNIYPQGGTKAFWCDTFIDWCFVKAYGEKKAKELLGEWSAYTPTSAQFFKDKKHWFTTPKVGDQIFFKNATRINHTGLVYKVDAARVYTIEGNTSNSNEVVANGGCVAEKSYLLSNSRIAGYGRPDYDDNSSSITNYNLGIDISSYQGKPDFSKVSSAGVKFVLARISIQNGQKDSSFDYAYEQCKKYNIPFGVYIYSYALTQNDAMIEAQRVVNYLKGKTIECGVFYDLEWDKQGVLGKTAITNIAAAFIAIIERSGYNCGIYTNLDWAKSKVDTVGLNRPLWIARYGKNNGMYDKTYKPNMKETIWQYTSKGSIPGINGNVDMNACYCDPLKIFSSSNVSTSPIATINNIVTASSLNVRVTPINGAVIGTLKKNDSVEIYELKNNWCKISTSSKWCSYKYIQSQKGAIANCSKLNCRQSPINGAVAFVLSAGDKVNILRQDKSSNWYFIECNGKTGYISNKYISI